MLSTAFTLSIRNAYADIRIRRGDTQMQQMDEIANICRLSDLRQGESGQIISIDQDSELYKRLGDFGIKEGTAVYCEHIGFLGDPAAYRFCGVSDHVPLEVNRGTVIAIRSRDAQHIRIKRAALSEKDGGSWG